MALVVKNLSANAVRDVGLTPGLGRSPGGGHGNLLQHSCLENPMDRGTLAGYSSLGWKESGMIKRLSSEWNPQAETEMVEGKHWA